jgi:hypothetical protein
MEVKGEWTPTTAGGGIDQPSWRSNTQYILKGVLPDQTVTITLKLGGAESTENESVGFAIIGKGGEGVLPPFYLQEDNVPVTAVTDEEGHFNLVHTTPPKKGQTEGIFLDHDVNSTQQLNIS